MSDLLIIVYNGIFTFFNTMLSLLFAPVDALLVNVIPNYTNLSSYIDSFFNFFIDIFYFVIGWLNIPSVAIDLILGYISFRIILFVGTISIKLFIRWFNALKV